ncbi:MAG: desulfoferrodoxin [Thermodesulfobacteriota bacterium]
MTKLNEVYKCELCGNLVEVAGVGSGDLTCCGQAMSLLAENSTDAAQEKHVPVLAKEEGGWRVTVGSVPHPMADDHYIQWVELIAGDTVHRCQLQPGGEPSAFFPVAAAQQPTARALCNLHGLWTGK